MLDLHLTIFKEPRGFMKVLQFAFAVLAFSTTVGFSTYFTFHADVAGCVQPRTSPLRQNVMYPFALDATTLTATVCEAPPSTETFHFATDVSAAARFYVGVGVIAMLYALAAAAVYVLANKLYTEDKRLPTADFVLHAALAVLWFVSACAWAQGATTLKRGCDPATWAADLCRGRGALSCSFQPDDFSGAFAKLNVSLIFGFLNIFLWAANLWFLWKETPWFKPKSAKPGAAAAGAGGAAATTARA